MLSHASRSVCVPCDGSSNIMRCVNCFKRDDDRNIQVTSPPLLTEENIEQHAAKKRKSAPLRSMKEWSDEEMTVLVRVVRANQGYIKTGTVHSIVFIFINILICDCNRNRHEV